jgi:hypothetical protein
VNALEAWEVNHGTLFGESFKITVDINPKKVIEDRIAELAEKYLKNELPPILRQIGREMAQELIRSVDFRQILIDALKKEAQEALQRLHIGDKTAAQFIEDFVRSKL